MESLEGHLLLASPELLDPNFVQAVVLMVQHDENGALGLVLNRPTDLTLSKAWEQVSQDPCERNDNLYVGGPCEGAFMAIHPFEEASQIEVLPGLYFATDRDHVKWLIQQGDENKMRFFVGYAGWKAGQLENEIDGGSWLIMPATIDRIFASEQTLWRRAKREIDLAAILGKANPGILPSDPGLN